MIRSSIMFPPRRSISWHILHSSVWRKERVYANECVLLRRYWITCIFNWLSVGRCRKMSASYGVSAWILGKTKELMLRICLLCGSVRIPWMMGNENFPSVRSSAIPFFKFVYCEYSILIQLCSPKSSLRHCPNSVNRPEFGKKCLWDQPEEHSCYIDQRKESQWLWIPGHIVNRRRSYTFVFSVAKCIMSRIPIRKRPPVSENR